MHRPSTRRLSTAVLSIATDDPGREAVERAVEVLRNRGLVAFPTETVYGLGADATDAEAVERIYEAKGRPAYNPLIVHVDSIERARECVAEWPDAAEVLAREFWPGPLTLVLAKSSRIPDVVTAGKPTVGVRIPSAPVALALIRALGHPIAAPSANLSNHVSPTTAAHVLADLNGEIEMVLDGGPTSVGLESTVVDLTMRHPRVLRPGPIPCEAISGVLHDPHVHDELGHPLSDGPAAPGMLPVHYATRTRALRIELDELDLVQWPERAALLTFSDVEDEELPVPEGVLIEHLNDPHEASRRLYAMLRALDDRGVSVIVVAMPPDTIEWHAVRDRLQRATRRLERG